MPHDIIDNRADSIHAQTGAAIVGSSSLSLGGDGNHTELSRWFDEPWDEAEEAPLIPRIICSEALL